MSEEKFTTLMVGTLENGRIVTKNLIKAYRVGGLRLLRSVDRAFERAQVTEFLLKQVQMSSSRAEKAVDKVYDGAQTAMTEVADRLAKIDDPFVRYFEVAGDASKEGVRFVRELSDKVARESEKLPETAAGKRVVMTAPEVELKGRRVAVKAPRMMAKKPVRRPVRKTTRRVAKRKAA